MKVIKFIDQENESNIEIFVNNNLVHIYISEDDCDYPYYLSLEKHEAIYLVKQLNILIKDI